MFGEIQFYCPQIQSYLAPIKLYFGKIQLYLKEEDNYNFFFYTVIFGQIQSILCEYNSTLGQYIHFGLNKIVFW